MRPSFLENEISLFRYSIPKRPGAEEEAHDFLF